MNRTVRNTLMAVVIAALAAVALGAKKTPEAVEQLQYCRMVADYKASDGAVGWPDYNHNYETVCKGK